MLTNAGIRMLLEAMVAADPWGPADSETGGSCCHFCGSCRKARYGEPDRFVHYSRCVWMKAADELGVDHPSHVRYVPPPLEAPCPECGFQAQTNDEVPGFYGPDSTGTLDDHHLHLAIAAGFTTVAEWLRGPIRYAVTNFFGQTVAEVVVHETESGLHVVSERTIEPSPQTESENTDDPDQ